MKNNTNNAFFPLFYSHTSFLSRLSAADFGTLIIAITISNGCYPSKVPLPENLDIIYQFMVEEAGRLFDRYTPRGKKSEMLKNPEKSEKRERYGNFDPNEAFQKALARSYGKKSEN